MIYFFADNHYDSHPGKNIFENLPGELKNKIDSNGGAVCIKISKVHF